MAIEKDEAKYILCCDVCCEPAYATDDFNDAVEYKKTHGWKSQKIDGDWVDFLPGVPGAGKGCGGIVVEGRIMESGYGLDKNLFEMILKEPEKFYRTKQWRQKRVTALDRDHYECQYCKAKSPSKYTKAVLVDHVVELKKAPILALSLANLKSSCFDCHEKKHERCFVGNAGKAIFFIEERW